MVRFAWKRDIGKKAKIMVRMNRGAILSVYPNELHQRKVKFPLELDVLDLCTDELRQKLLPVNVRLKEIERDRAERRKVRKRTKTVVGSGVAQASGDVEMTEAAAAGPPSPVLLQAPAPAGAEPPTADEKGKAVAGSALEPESEYRARELQELESLIPADVRNDVGCSATGLYELVGIVAHKGAAADSGHYIGFVKKSAFHPVRIGSEGSASGSLDEDDEDWFKFDDEKVSIFPKEKLSTLEGGGNALFYFNSSLGKQRS